MLACTLDSPDLGRVRVINLHATAGGAYRRKRRRGAPDRRSAQIAQAIEAAGAAFEGTVVLAGDFNCDPAADPTTDRLLQAAGLLTLLPVYRMTPGLKARGIGPIRSTKAAPPAPPAGWTTSSCGRATIQKSR